ncbi:MAG: LysR substrate-binding domain-containing protein, partial [Pseudomonadota bacterium]
RDSANPKNTEQWVFRDCANVHLGTRLEPFDLVQERFDVAIHYGTQDWPNADLTKLCVEEMVAVASPTLLGDADELSPNTIAKQPLLHLESRPTAWADWLALHEVETPTLLPGKRFDQFTMVIAAATAGLGFGLLPKYLIEAELETGQLIPISQTALTTENAYYLARASGVRSAHVDGFMRWIRNQIPSRSGHLNE